jgi:hypothetical protein
MGNRHETASEVSARDGDVHVSGPGGLEYCMSPEAASETSDRLLGSAAQAQGQRVESKRAAAEYNERHPARP